jgi:hypothetical protein
MVQVVECLGGFGGFAFYEMGGVDMLALGCARDGQMSGLGKLSIGDQSRMTRQVRGGSV